jgi:hypothetical protein
MRFEPKVILPDETPTTAEGDIDLPADLEALAGQLGDDARRLAECYPAEASARPLGAVSPLADRRRQWRAALAATAVVLVGIAIAGGLQKWHAPADTQASVSPAAAQDRTAVIEDATAGGEQRSLDLEASRGRPTLSLTDLSPPELEGLLDLLERDPHQAVRISF